MSRVPGQTRRGWIIPEHVTYSEKPLFALQLRTCSVSVDLLSDAMLWGSMARSSIPGEDDSGKVVGCFFRRVHTPSLYMSTMLAS